jgi:hypothetical protein
MSQEHGDREHDRNGIPPGLARDLAVVARPAIDVPRQVDEAVMAEARRVLRGSRRAAAGRRRARLAAAAVLALATVLVALVASQRTPPRVLVRGDVDGSGSVDIVDAYLLAGRLEAGRSAAGADLNGDGAVDAADVQAIAMQAVALPKEAG